MLLNAQIAVYVYMYVRIRTKNYPKANHTSIVMQHGVKIQPFKRNAVVVGLVLK